MGNFLLKLSLLLIISLSTACTSLEESEKERLRQRQRREEFVLRQDKEQHYPLRVPEYVPPKPYPWQQQQVGNFPNITKEFLRCNGSHRNPIKTITLENGNDQLIRDCEGRERHSLPLVEGKETIYPILLKLLNYLQERTGKHVVVTCGHRCPEHNLYADSSKANRMSKHLIGAEVDFYLEDMEEQPQEIVNLLMDYFYSRPEYEGGEEYLHFQRYTKGDTNVSTLPWYNKEIYIKLFKANEGRDLDNRHPYPYVSVQVRYDKKAKHRVHYSWDLAHKGYQKW